VLCNEEWRATRRGEVGDKEGLVLSSSSRRLIASCTAESHRFAAAMRSLREPKVGVIKSGKLLGWTVCDST
jgi:hypothetical protein